MVQEAATKHYRKKTSLAGFYQKLTPPHISDKILVTDVSFTGCGFDAPVKHFLRPGDPIKITFALDDTRGSMIRKEAVIRKVEGYRIGCQFVTLPGAYDPDLGFYLRDL
jgi:hypothetical protein